ncbi:putative lipoprotein [Streptococcus pneumoniae]|uniref:Putative lipoprotein n=8 Tax=Streptococcus pneumoniae TaxID=1313 RepID=A0A4J2AFQ8_STREE|nr:DUF6287 domain-containing protein [Streptococcus pneumoniae]CEX81865.1 putative lipoprotein [Streptococcus pneumoniae]CIZ95820.1 putative lipoprotein [Streptococcus pneumoniae]CJE74636.1 putative lipoprotein [Streptococcus pneumoniae]COD22318.1 putative lipoprotein [Streptococcus pneumoniae]COL02363.1 putative lipoprotein [Streptococcus pneumoniae]
MKKFLLATTLLLTLVLGGCQYLPWNKSAETPSDSTSETSVATPEIDYSSYNKVLDDYEKVAKGTLPTGMDVNPLASQVKSSQGFYTDVVYHKTDLNNDGVDELLLALEMKSGEKSLLDIRTLKDEKVIRLTNQENRLDQIGERMTVGILPDNSLLYRGAGTATSHIYAHYQFSEDGQSLVKDKEAQELADLGVGSPISLETLSWKSVSDKLPGGSSADKGKPSVDYSPYNSILKDYEFILDHKSEVKDNINPTANIYAGMAERSQAFTYAMVDMDKNGIDELIVSSKNGSEILDIFTLKDQKVIRLTNAENKMQMLGTRFKAYLLENGNLYTQWNPFAGDPQTIHTIWKLNSSGDKLEKVKEAKTEDEVSPGTRMNLSSLTWKSVTEKFAATASSTSKTASGKMDINAIKNGDFSSIEGRWSNGHGGEDLVFSKDGLIAPEKFKVDLTESEFVNGFLRARYSAPDFGIFIQFVPAGVRIPDGTSRGELVTDASDISKDRIIFHAAFPLHGDPRQFLYRVE